MINKGDLAIYDGYIVNIIDVNDRITVSSIFYKVADSNKWIDSSKVTELVATKDNYYNLLQLFKNNTVYEEAYLFLLFEMDEEEDCWNYNGAKIHNYQDYRNAYKKHFGKDIIFNSLIKSKLNPEKD